MSQPVPTAPRKSHKGRTVLIVLGVLVALLVVGGLVGGSKSKTSSSPSATPSSSPVSVPTAPAPKKVSPPAVPAAQSHVFQGNGIKTTPNFTVTADQWTIAYKFSCAAFGGTGNFIVNVNDSTGATDFNHDGVNALAAAGNDSTVEHGAGTYSLEVNSECAWTVVVTG